LGNWSGISIEGGPGSRAGHVAIFRQSTAEMIVFAGMTDSEADSVDEYSDAETNIVWILSLADMNWRSTTPNTVSPMPRVEAVGDVYENDMYVFGGVNFQSKEIFGDLWKFNLDNEMWTLIYNGEKRGPLPRFGHAGCFFASSFVIYAGQRIANLDEEDFEMIPDLWSFDVPSQNWTEATAFPLLHRSYHSLVSFENRVWSFGGFASGCVGTAILPYF